MRHALLSGITAAHANPCAPVSPTCVSGTPLQPEMLSASIRSMLAAGSKFEGHANFSAATLFSKPRKPVPNSKAMPISQHLHHFPRCQAYHPSIFYHLQPCAYKPFLLSSNGTPIDLHLNGLLGCYHQCGFHCLQSLPHDEFVPNSNGMSIHVYLWVHPVARSPKTFRSLDDNI
ncbi:hypothetical protein CIPAW_03G190300 [Carya illinoinensis]|uniref:Uncharacterized protein n=1 Tax=Carya illinoinensis TaxID=32201 RepID=A0A8T1R334_CARIL|nr:hypothetical protein CIPAW_03G190300 [Carya illinoinensis]